MSKRLSLIMTDVDQQAVAPWISAGTIEHETLRATDFAPLAPDGHPLAHVPGCGYITTGIAWGPVNLERAGTRSGPNEELTDSETPVLSQRDFRA